MTELTPLGEDLAISERIVISPVTGRLVDTVLRMGDRLERGQVLGYVIGPGQRVAITSPFDGQIGGCLTGAGDRVPTGAPIVWLRGDDDAGNAGS